MHAILNRIRRGALLAEALAALVLSSALIALFPFRRVAAMAAKGRKDARPASASRAFDIGWAVAGWGRRVPWHAMCFQQGLAAQMMLRRRCLASALYYGARREVDGVLVAHIWVRSAHVDVIGCEGSEAYGLLAVFSAAD